MRVISCSLTNFASYKQLDFNFTDQGLTLIQGRTGSGKSTLCDAVPWVLFGTTAKGGPVSDVISWPGDGAAKGTVYLEGGLAITRIRGRAKDNDLYFVYENDTDTVSPQRGKDLLDTQRLINSILGINVDLYLAGAYFHEFSQTAQFFTTTAKNRRAICEQIVDLSLAQKLHPKLADKHKELKHTLDKINQDLRDNEFKLSEKKRAQTSEHDRSAQWVARQVETKSYVATCYDKFESGRSKTISKACNSCGTVLEHPKKVVDNSVNPHLSRLAELELETNPFSSEIKDFQNEINKILTNIDMLECFKTERVQEQEDIELLQYAVADYRSASIINTIQAIEAQTNELLTRHFDAEIKVEFEVADADKLDIIILKDSNICSYTQLSKGQRCLLKLCFGVSMMKCAANHAGIKFHQLFFDEALDGLDEQMKGRAFRLLEELSLEYESVFCVEHSEGLKNLFHNRHTVILVKGESQIEKA